MENEFKKEPKLGLWLQLFRIHLIIIAGLLPVYIFFSLIEIIFFEVEANFYLLFEVSSWVKFILSVYIIKILKNKDPNVPNIVMGCIAWEMIFSCLLYSNSMEIIQIYIPYYFVSYYYFKKSKKVKEYYGANYLSNFYKDIPLLNTNFRG